MPVSIFEFSGKPVLLAAGQFVVFNDKAEQREIQVVFRAAPTTLSHSQRVEHEENQCGVIDLNKQVIREVINVASETVPRQFPSGHRLCLDATFKPSLLNITQPNSECGGNCGGRGRLAYLGFADELVAPRPVPSRRQSLLWAVSFVPTHLPVCHS